MSRSHSGVIQHMAPRRGRAAELESALEFAYPELRRRTHLYVWKSGLARTHAQATEIGDDILHAALERVVKKANTYDPIRPIHAWAMKFVANVILERKRAQRHDADHLADEFEPSTGDGRELLSRLEMVQDLTTQRHNRLQELLTLVGPADRQVLELRFVNGLSFRELGAALGISENAARVRHHRALNRLTHEYFAAEQAGSEER